MTIIYNNKKHFKSVLHLVLFGLDFSDVNLPFDNLFPPNSPSEQAKRPFYKVMTG